MTIRADVLRPRGRENVPTAVTCIYFQELPSIHTSFPCAHGDASHTIRCTRDHCALSQLFLRLGRLRRAG